MKGVTVDQIPQSKEELAKALSEPKEQRKILEKHHLSYKPQRISHWLQQDEVYDSNVKYGEIFEPYFVAHRNLIFYDEIFNGCFYDKLSHVDNVKYLGFRLKILPDTFIIHLDHGDIKNYKNWCRGYEAGKRLKLKNCSFWTTTREFKGILENRYYPPWLSNISNKIFTGCLDEKRVCGISALTHKLEKTKAQVRFLGTSLILSLILFVFAAIAYFKKRNDNS